MHRAFAPRLRLGRGRLIQACQRVQALIAPPSNPRPVGSVRELPRMRMVNEAPGTGTRTPPPLGGLSPESVPGHGWVAATHLAVATAVAAGQADVGFRIEATARQIGADFGRCSPRTTSWSAIRPRSKAGRPAR